MKKILTIIGPGVLVAATGVGAGDLAMAALCGRDLGTSLIWAIVLGAAFKFLLTEGLARWQLVTGTTLIDGLDERFGAAMRFPFLAYLLIWSFFVGVALIKACAVTSVAIFTAQPGPNDLMISGIIHSAVAVVLVWLGGYKLFERVMSACIGLMFCLAILGALFVIQLPPVDRPVPTFDQQVRWVLQLIGGVGGTVTILCYGYWIREEGREGESRIGISRIDVGSGYLLTALFGISMLLIASRVPAASGSGVGLITSIASLMGGQIHPSASYIFLVGAWCATFSSLLGVWQSIPYLFADIFDNSPEAEGPTAVNTRGWMYRGYLLMIATVPLLGIGRDFASVQRVYAMVGVAFIPMLAAGVLFLLNDRRMGRWRNGLTGNAGLICVLLFFVLAGIWKVMGR